MDVDIRAFTTNGFQPFCKHRDAAAERLSEAHALLQVIGDAAFEREGVLGEMNSDIQGNIFRGIAALVAYAQYHLAAAATEERDAHQGEAV